MASTSEAPVADGAAAEAKLADLPPPEEVSRRFVASDLKEEVFCVRFSPDDEFVAASTGDGNIAVYMCLNGRRAFTLKTSDPVPLPVTQVKWRPLAAAGDSVVRDVLLSVGGDGKIIHWNTGTRKAVSEITETGNQIFCCDYRQDGLQFGVAGLKRSVSIYDEPTRKLVSSLRGGEAGTSVGHSNRIFSLKYHPTSTNMLCSGSWDKMVQFWDVRVGHAVREIWGAHVCGDSVDIDSTGSLVLTGSWRLQDQLQLWDFGKAKLIETVQWPLPAEGADAAVSSAPVSPPVSPQGRPSTSGGPTPRRISKAQRTTCQVYAAQFSKHDGGQKVCAGGSGVGEVKIFDRRRGWSVIGEISGFTGSCYSVDFSHDGEKIAVGSSDGSVRCVNLI